MTPLFSRRKPGSQVPTLWDLDQQPLHEGDLVEAYRYQLGKARLLLLEGVYTYESLDTGQQVSHLLMIDAITQRQKVRKLTNYSPE